MKKPWLAVLLSFVYPGLGHLYLGYVKKGIILILAEIVSILLMSVVVGIFLFPIVWIYGMIDAYHSATRNQKIS
ncbi:sugar ABC transporter permease [Paenibacillus elgii]|uniref:Sugar ABC transporter permease n=1 Tax=Paenibacillus elgii TaxID=189691 RepID=A0A2T6G941_9BACL|nr:sugar ABC transporter permease [Paenibacillus elgii]PUA40664.1 sugar ABC transporter permease [Paenibacillus elgii]